MERMKWLSWLWYQHSPFSTRGCLACGNGKRRGDKCYLKVDKTLNHLEIQKMAMLFHFVTSLLTSCDPIASVGPASNQLAWMDPERKYGLN